MPMTKREETIAKLSALANDPNVNEHIAKAAIEKLHAYAAQYGLNIEDILAKGDATNASHYKATDGMFSTKGTGWDMVDKFVSKHIAEYYCCKLWGNIDSDGDRVVFFYGHEVDVEAASALRWIVRAAMANDWRAWFAVKRDSVGYLSKEAIADMKLSFHRAMGERLAQRMAFYHRPDSVVKGGTSLIVLKGELTLRHFADYAKSINLNLHPSRARMSGNHGEAAAAGRAAGDRVTFGQGIGNKTLRLGH